MRVKGTAVISGRPILVSAGWELPSPALALRNRIKALHYIFGRGRDRQGGRLELLDSVSGGSTAEQRLQRLRCGARMSANGGKGPQWQLTESHSGRMGRGREW